MRRQYGSGQKTKVTNRFDRALRYVESILGDDITDNVELGELCTKLFGHKFLGVFSADTLLNVSAKQPYAICNLDASDQKGSHWVAIRWDKPKTITVYDGFNRAPKQILPELNGTGFKVIKQSVKGSAG